ncbi:MAG TPA: hypothetical protein VNJ07_12185, partial [Chitinophagales bacterium]|nr:hypothetical protein [Chitinophagales bacterium]
ALKDENFNYIYDLPNEELAFHDSVLTLHENVAQIRLRLFREDREIPLKRIGLDDSKPGLIRLFYSRGVDEIEVKSASDGFSIAQPEYNKTRDTIAAWYIRAVANDTLRLVVNEDSAEEIAVRNVPSDTDSLKKIFSKFSFVKKDSLISTEGMITAALNHPVLAAEFGRVIIEQDSPKVEIKPAEIQFTAEGNRIIGINFPRRPDVTYSIIFPAGIMADYFGMRNDTLIWKVKTKSPEDYGSLKLTISGQQIPRCLLQLINSRSGSILKEESFTNSTRLEFGKVVPGEYEIIIIYDSNRNGKWDTGNFLRHLQPERTYRHPEKITIRANWEVEAELQLQ